MRRVGLQRCWHPRLGPWWVLLAVVSFSDHAAVAQIYKIEGMPVPGKRSLQLLHPYYVYSSDEAPDRSVGDPLVEYQNLVAHSLDKKDGELKDYFGIQLSLMKYEDFHTLIDPHYFCCGVDDVHNGLCAHVDQLLVKKAPGERYRDVAVYTDTVHFPDGTPSFRPKDVTRRVRESGVYVLMISNCGTHQSASVSGSVIVKNAYGFLPGSEYPKLPFYGWLSVTYMVMAVIWLALSLNWWKDIFNIQKCIGGVILLGLVECLIWWIFFYDWNKRGIHTHFAFELAMLISGTKLIFSYTLVLVAALGWGVTRPYLDKDILIRIKCVVVLYILLGVARAAVLDCTHGRCTDISLHYAVVSLYSLPASLLNGVICVWVSTALSNLMQTLNERGQTAKLNLFQQLRSVLVIALSVALGVMIFQIFYFSKSLESRWMHQWLFTDGIPHLLFLMVLTFMMYLWAPSSGSQRVAYSAQADSKDPENDDGKPVVTVVADDWNDEGLDDDDSFWLSGNITKPPTKVPV